MKPVPYNPTAGIGLEQSPQGHVRSPWWTYDCEKEIVKGRVTYFCGSRFHSTKAQAVSAFSSVLYIQPEDVMCSQKPIDDEGVVWWRLTTKTPVKLPERRQKALPARDPLAIDI